MPFKPGHKKVGGRKRGTPNKDSVPARDLARALLGTAEYQVSLEQRLIAGTAPKMELFLWRALLGTPQAEPEDLAADPTNLDLAHLLEALGDPDPEDPDELPVEEIDAIEES